METLFTTHQRQSSDCLFLYIFIIMIHIIHFFEIIYNNLMYFYIFIFSKSKSHNQYNAIINIKINTFKQAFCLLFLLLIYLFNVIIQSDINQYIVLFYSWNVFLTLVIFSEFLLVKICIYKTKF